MTIKEANIAGLLLSSEDNFQRHIEKRMSFIYVSGSIFRGK